VNIIQTYGYEVLLTLHNLEKCGLLKRSESGKNVFPTLRKGLKLYDEGVDEVDPKDISFAYSGYGFTFSFNVSILHVMHVIHVDDACG
jgi:vacuolar protein sorting-associated protein 33A